VSCSLLRDRLAIIARMAGANRVFSAEHASDLIRRWLPVDATRSKTNGRSVSSAAIRADLHQAATSATSGRSVLSSIILINMRDSLA